MPLFALCPVLQRSGGPAVLWSDGRRSPLETSSVRSTKRTHSATRKTKRSPNIAAKQRGLNDTDTPEGSLHRGVVKATQQQRTSRRRRMTASDNQEQSTVHKDAAKPPTEQGSAQAARKIQSTDRVSAKHDDRQSDGRKDDDVFNSDQERA